MHKYISFFRLRFAMGLQYRAAAIGGIVTQFLWGFMECLAFRAFWEAAPEAFPMDFSAVVAYVWLREAFFALFTAWHADNEIFDSIINGDIAYELCRPLSIYHMWFARTVGIRLANASIRCLPILLASFFMPEPFRMTLPQSPASLCLFVLTMFLGLGVTVAFCMFVYILSFFTISPQGLRMTFTSMVEFLAGAIIPLPFMPDGVRKALELLPFAGMFNVPLRIYSGDLAGAEMLRAIGLQCFWLAALYIAGRILCRAAERKVVVQGG
ncbi:MAG: ABC-2 family transporter protein [Roseburia sp.]|nr:ABC-2 family transporter protein [Roseburia sp.]MCM1241357.1 ABC-2 family transporter protein [Roseburia sp.]